MKKTLCAETVVDQFCYSNPLFLKCLSMARAGLVRLSDAVFEKDGKQIPYRTVNVTRLGQSVDQQTPIEFVMKVAMPVSAERKGKKRAIAPAKRKRQRKLEKSSPQNPAAVQSGSGSRVEGALREWRKSEARRRGLPAFRIFSDKTLGAIARQLLERLMNYSPFRALESPQSRSTVRRSIAC